MEQTKHIEWLGASQMHQDTLNWDSELKFIKDEQVFFDDLITYYTLQLINLEHFEESKQVVETLKTFQKNTNSLLGDVKTHRNSLQILVDGINQLEEEKIYRIEHKNLVIKLIEFKETYNLFKSTFFNYIKSIIKENKQMRLLE